MPPLERWGPLGLGFFQKQVKIKTKGNGLGRIQEKNFWFKKGF